MMNKTCYFTFLALAFGSTLSFAQNSPRESDIMYRKQVVRAMDLRELQNSSLFSKNREITAFIINAVNNGKLIPYSNDSLTTRIPLAEFTQRMTMPGSGPVSTDTADFMIQYPDTWREEMANQSKPELYFPKDLYQLELKEDVYFTKGKSQLDYNIKSLSVYIPADHPANIRGIQTIVASFDYKELEKLFKDSPNAIAFNSQNDSQHKNLADAFKLRLFSSYIIKVSNPDDKYISDIYTDQGKGIMASQWAGMELMEYEHNLWEF